MKETSTAAPAPAALRWGITLLATLLAFLLIWLLGFVLRDIGDLQGPDFADVSRGHVDPALTNEVADHGKTVDGPKRVHLD